MKKWLKRIGVALLVALVILQFVRPDKNQGTAQSGKRIQDVIPVSNEVQTILRTSCNDCHSNYTEPMWYMNIQPIGLWIAHHIEEGKEELNFDEFATYSVKKQNHKLEEVAEMINEGEMPLSSYTLMHGNAELSQQQKDVLINWVNTSRANLKGQLPGGNEEHEEGEDH